ncbi:MAG: DNA polymerase domain-containing protein [Candidatus Hodarchaeales archaeon]|jgi:DNA polymerase elongation subunit (family B)
MTEKSAPSNTPLESGADYFLLSTNYDSKSNGAGLKLLDIDKGKLVYITDPFHHEPYCLSFESVEEINHKKIPRTIVKRVIEIKKRDLLNDQDRNVTQIFTVTPSEVPKVREILEDTWESRIKYHRNWIYDQQLVPGRKYQWDSNKNHFIDPPEQVTGLKLPESVLTRLKQYGDLLTNFLPDFTQEIPNFPIVSCDIETEYAENQIPQADDPKFRITCICFSDSEDKSFSLLLEREGVNKGKYPDDKEFKSEVERFQDEPSLIKRAFEIINKYPICVTFNGDNFDFPYLHERSKVLKVGKYSPIQWNRRNRETSLKNGIHLDLYRFYRNVAIKTYAFGNKYQEGNLDSIASALLGVGKVTLNKPISELTEWELIYYCDRDARITLNLLLFDNKTPLNLIFILSRITRTPINDLTRTSVSNWVQSLFYSEHRRKGYLIPNSEDIQKMKGVFRSSEAIIKGKKYKGATVIDPIPGIHFDVTVLDFASLYPSIIGTFNLSYETVLCSHQECKTNLVPQTNYWVCQKERGIIADTIGFIKDVRVQWLKPESKKESAQKEFFGILEKSLKVLINACLPYDEEVIVKHRKTGIIENRKIGSLTKDWQELDVLSISRKQKLQFGKPIFVPINGYYKRKMNKILTLTLSDGRSFRCTPNHFLPKVLPYNGSQKPLNLMEHFEEVPASTLNAGDEILIQHKILLSQAPIEKLFIPDFINCDSFWVGIKRDDYKKFSYHTNETTNEYIINLVNTQFRYSKTSKIYKAVWNNLSSKAKLTIKNEDRFSIFLKIHDNVGKWYNIQIPLDDDFFLLLGWYVSDGSVSKNRFSISQSKKKHPGYWNEIKNLLDKLNLSYYCNDQGFAVHSNILSLLLESLCGRGAKNKRLPLQFFNIKRANIFLSSYFKGDGSWETNRRKLPAVKKDEMKDTFDGALKRSFSTISSQLKNQLLILLGATGKYASVQSDLAENKWQQNVRYKIIETSGRHYKRKFMGLLDYNGTTPVRIKSIANSNLPQPVFDITTGNGWFITTNGVVVHNSYGVLGSDRFPLYCLPVADSTTAYGRDSIERTIEKARSLDVKVLYGDTDSVFLLSPSEAQIKGIIRWSQEELGVSLEVEKTYRYVVLSERKKNYFGVYPNSDIDVKGLMGKKRNTPPFLQKAFQAVLTLLSKVTTLPEFEEALQQVKKYVRGIYQNLEKNSYSYSDLAITMQVTQPLHHYKVQAQHVKAAWQLEKDYQAKQRISQVNKLKKPSFIKPGQFIRFVKTKTPERVTALELMSEKFKVDIKAYRSMVDTIFEQLFGALDIEVEELASGQVNLMEFFN